MSEPAEELFDPFGLLDLFESAENCRTICSTETRAPSSSSSPPFCIFRRLLLEGFILFRAKFRRLTQLFAFETATVVIITHKLEVHLIGSSADVAVLI